ncbi:MAG: hypothetical protein AAFS10_07595, partial [Myxococcota bacterium]
MPNLHQLLKVMVEKGSSDLHLSCGSPPQLRIDGPVHHAHTPTPDRPVDDVAADPRPGGQGRLVAGQRTDPIFTDS